MKCQVSSHFYLLAVVHNDELFIFGGYNGCDDLHFGDMFKFSPGENCND